MSSKDRLRQLEATEKHLVNCVQSLGLALQELAKEKPMIKQVEAHSNNFLQGIETVETNLNAQINYLTQVSTGQTHEGSSYGQQKVLNMAWHRLEHSRSRLKELERLRAHHVHETLEQLSKQQQQERMKSEPNADYGHPGHEQQEQGAMAMEVAEQPQQ